MTVEEIKTRIAKKEEEIAKLERLYAKYTAGSPIEKAIIDRFLESGDRTEYREYLKTKNQWWGGDAWTKANELYSARETLAKYHKQLEAQIAKENTLAEIPEVIKEFASNLEERWNSYDLWRKEAIRKEYNSFDYNTSAERHQFYHEMREKWGVNWYESMYLTRDQIEKQNKDAVNALVLNLVTRTVEIAGTIEDAQYLRLDRDNNGYAIINGVVIGSKGKARVESIGAGGYNIQRYHIRVLVKEVRA